MILLLLFNVSLPEISITVQDKFINKLRRLSQFAIAEYYMISGYKKDPSPEFLSFAGAQLEILPSPARGEGPATPGVEPTRPLWEGRNLWFRGGVYLMFEDNTLKHSTTLIYSYYLWIYLVPPEEHSNYLLHLPLIVQYFYAGQKFLY